MTTAEAPVELRWGLLQRTILPLEGQADVVPLYVDAGSANGVRLVEDDGMYRVPKRREDKLNLVSSSEAEAHYEDFLSRESMAVRPGQHVSFGTYFNAFPASYWRRWTSVREIRLVVETKGRGAVVVYKTNARGAIQRVAGKRVDGDGTATVFDLTLKPFGDGGWYWFDVNASVDGLELTSARWEGLVPPRVRETSITLQITTVNKPQFCIDNARILADSLDRLDAVREILIVDQGTDKVRDHPDFLEIEAGLGGRLRVIEQTNLGGSGGFARGMFEALEGGHDYALLLDDDVVIEPESITRLVTFADLCRKPTIVGGHMFDLYNRTTLHTFGEVVDLHRVQPAPPHEDMELGHDFSRSNLRQTRWLHRRTDVDYNGWWMCLIPTEVMREIGLAMPVFIKWDDSEYGLRARNAGFNTVSFPGAAVWHVSWVDKDDLVGWQAYFHERNRTITALLHSEFAKSGRVLRESVQNDVKHLVSMQYFTQHGRIMALRDLFDGPEGLHNKLAAKLPEINAVRAQYSDAQIRSDVDDFPSPKAGRSLTGGPAIAPSKKQLVPWALKTVSRQLLRAPLEDSTVRPQGFLAHRDNKWWRLAGYDSVIVSNAEGTGASWYQRKPELLRSMLAEATRLHARLYRDWEQLAERYRAGMPKVTSIDAWRETFTKHTVFDTGRADSGGEAAVAAEAEA
ncbi:glycosyltransferase [Sinomonas sp. ASV322]|uniref:glycosyltransferase n=1 Tax=Sinomonas sp. ASV322 TaxID=3041920 RepID=UPI0027DCD596|nr:glycosyltransferase [Sinomonas sp. ASV322]MDQ4503250.1 glycosyltransferase [Sinomonas sp. ASV322]